MTAGAGPPVRPRFEFRRDGFGRNIVSVAVRLGRRFFGALDVNV